MKLVHNGTGWSLMNGNKAILSQKIEKPVIYVGCGQENVDIYRGNSKIEDYVTERRPLATSVIKVDENKAEIGFGGEMTAVTRLDGSLTWLSFINVNPAINRLRSHVDAKETEHCYDCGEQVSYFNLCERHFPLWTSEPGMGRDETTYVTWRPDVENGGVGGDCCSTNYPQPTSVSSGHYYLHMGSAAYADFDFHNPDFHELQIWEAPASIRIEAADSFLELSEKGSAFFGYQPGLPE